MHTSKARRMVVVGVVAAALALASIGSAGVSASEATDDNSGGAVIAPVAQQPFTYEYGVSALPAVATAPFVNPNALADYGNHDN